MYRCSFGCNCHTCIRERNITVGGLPLNTVQMIVCPICGNKRCPKADNHRNACTGSNEPGGLEPKSLNVIMAGKNEKS